MDKVIQRPLTKSEISDILQFLSYHLNYTPIPKLHLKFAKTPSVFERYYDKFRTETPGDTCTAFFDHVTYTAVFRAYTLVDSVLVPKFIMPMSTVVHELIHYYQYSTGSYGTWQTMYEGTAEILSCFYTDDYAIDYDIETRYAFNLAMALNDDNFWEAMNWIKKYTTHSDKNKFVSRSILQSPKFQKYRPSNIMRWLDTNKLNRIKNEEVRNLFTKLSLGQIKKMLHTHRQLI
jgi:hypothetical protein